MNPVVGREEQRAVDVRERAGDEVRDGNGARRGAVALPQLDVPEPSLAEKNSVPLTFVRLVGYELALPGLMSLTSTVPAAVPSLFHSSRPCTAVVGREEQRAVDVRQVAGVRAG